MCINNSVHQLIVCHIVKPDWHLYLHIHNDSYNNGEKSDQRAIQTDIFDQNTSAELIIGNKTLSKIPEKTGAYPTASNP